MGCFPTAFLQLWTFPTKTDVCLFTTVYLLSQSSEHSPPLLRKNCTCLQRADPGELQKKKKQQHLTLNSPQTILAGVCTDTHTLVMHTRWLPCRAPLYSWPHPSPPWVGQPWPSVLECLFLRLSTWSPATIWVWRDGRQIRMNVSLLFSWSEML